MAAGGAGQRAALVGVTEKWVQNRLGFPTAGLKWRLRRAAPGDTFILSWLFAAQPCH